MGAIEETRRVLSPEVRATSTRLDTLEIRLDGIDKRFDGVEKHFDGVDRKFEGVERRAERRHDEVMGALRQMIDLTSIQQRLAKLASQQMARQ